MYPTYVIYACVIYKTIIFLIKRQHGPRFRIYNNIILLLEVCDVSETFLHVSYLPSVISQTSPSPTPYPSPYPIGTAVILSYCVSVITFILHVRCLSTTGFAWATVSTCARTRSCANTTTRNGWCSPTWPRTIRPVWRT